MKKFILPVLSILFASFQANAEEWQIKEAGVIRYAPPEVFARHYSVTEQRALFEIKFYQILPIPPQNYKEQCTSFGFDNNIITSNKISDTSNVITHSFLDKNGKSAHFEYTPNPEFVCAIRHK